MSEGLMDRK